MAHEPQGLDLQFADLVAGRLAGPHEVASEAEIDAFWTLLTREDGLAAMPALITYITERRRHRERWVGALCNARVPIRLIDGLADPISGAHMVARFRELVPNAPVHELPRVGHYPADGSTRRRARRAMLTFTSERT
jgi:pimeloyl-ACP methyl ester carboxylesterase